MKTFRRNPKHRDLPDDVRSQRRQAANEVRDEQQNKQSSQENGEEVRDDQGDE